MLTHAMARHGAHAKTNQKERVMQAHLGDLSNLALERADDLVSLGALHVLVVVASVEIAPVLGPVLLHNLLHSDQLSAATFVLMTRMQAWPNALRILRE